MDRVETLASALEQDADQIDQHLGVARRGFHRGGVAQIGLHRVDLADAAERLQMEGEVGPAHRHPDAVVALGQRAHHVAAEKAGAAIDGDEGVGMGCVRSCRSRFGQRRGCLEARAIQDRPQAVQARNGSASAAMRFN